METFFAKEFYGNTVLNWAISLSFIVGAIIAGKILYWFSGKVLKQITKKTKTRLDDILIDMLEEPIVFAIITFGFWLGITRLNFSESADTWFKNLVHVFITINITWLISRVFVSLVNEYIKPLTEKTESDLDDQLLPVVKKGINSIIWILGIIIALNNAGYDVGALLAGLGIGGLALAMAAKDSVSNIFGGFTIFTDKPFKINDRIRIGSYDGTVVEIGLRSFRLQTLDGTVVTIPNSQITGSMVENVTLEPARKILMNLGLTYDTTPEQMQLAMDILRSIAEKQEGLTQDTKIAFTDYGDFSLGILFIYYIKKEADILGVRTSINLEILKQFNENKLNFAFPTQTIQVEKQ